MREASLMANLILFLELASTLPALEPQPGADQWLTNAPAPPPPYANVLARTNSFATLKAEAIAGKLRLAWETAGTFSEVKLIASAGSPGHWPARDWRTYLMRRSGDEWITEVPVDCLDVPIVYFVAAQDAARTTASPMRIVLAGALGLEQPSRIFWPFIEGFEQGLEGWRLSDGTELHTTVPPRNGRAALALRVPEGRRTVTVATTRMQGWFLEEHAATGLALWLKASRGGATATFTLFANAHSTNQIIARRDDAVSISDRWTKVDLPFRSFPNIPLGEIDLFSMEITAKPGTEVLVDDVHLLGRWRTDL